MPLFLSILQSLSTMSFYAKVIDHSFGQIFWLLFRFIIIIIVANALSMIPFAKQIAEESGAWVEKTLPPLTIKAGVLSSESTTPFIYKGKIEAATGGSEPYELVIDTSSTNYPTITSSNLSMTFAVASQGIQMEALKGPFPAKQEITFKHLPDGRINAKYVEDYLSASLKMIIFVFGLFFVGFMILFYGFFINLFFIGSTFALEKLTGSFLTISQISKISCCATIPALLICSIYFWVRFFLIDIQLIFLLVYGIYFLLGTTAARRRRLAEIVRNNASDDDEM